MDFKKTKYPVYKCGENTEYNKTKAIYNEDDYGSPTSYIVDDWVPFQSDQYFINIAEVEYSDPIFYPVAPSGKYSPRYGGLYKKQLRNLDLVGYFDGESFDFEMPYMYTSIHELEPNDVIVFKKDIKYRDGIWKHSKIKTIQAGSKLMLKKFGDILFGPAFEITYLIELDTDIEHKICGDFEVEKIGKIVYEPVFVEL